MRLRILDPKGGVETAGDVRAALEAGRSLMIFPEGTFDRRPGLRAFHMGAFVSACAAGVPVLPLGLSGTRGILRGESGFARRGTIKLAVGAAIQPAGEDWEAAIALRDTARGAILRLCEEPDLIGEPTRL